MPLVSARCTSCGASLEVDSVKDAAICPYCNTAYIVEKAIQSYSITNHNNIHANIVNVYGGDSSGFKIVAGMLMRYTGPECNVTIPNAVTGINHHAFASLRNLISVTIPESVTYIGSDAFFSCQSLTSVTLPQGLKRIETGTFWRCTGLTSVIIPEGVSSIGFDAFHDCTSLKHITIPNSVTEIGTGAFEGCSSLIDVRLPDSITNIDQVFHGTPWLEQAQSKKGNVSETGTVELLQPTQADLWRDAFRCEYCGGRFKGIFTHVCRNCGRKKTY